MEAYFIYNALRVKPHQPIDTPCIPGFRMLSWKAFIEGHLWSTGDDVIASAPGNSRIPGQVWLPDNYDKLNLLREFCRFDEGLTVEKKVLATLYYGNVTDKLMVTSYVLKKVDKNYKLLVQPSTL